MMMDSLSSGNVQEREAASVDPFVETEIKLVAGKRRLDALALDAREAGAKAGRVDSEYFDTSDRALRGRGVSMRLRPKGDRYELTMKQAGDGAIARGEWTSVLDSPVADPRLLPEEAPAGCLGAADDLAPVFATEFDRLKQVVRFGGGAAELAIDRGCIRAGEKTTALNEVELELIEGEPAGLLRYAIELAERYGLRVSSLSKADRGYALADAAPPGWVKARRPELARDLTVEDAVRLILGQTADQIRGNIAAANDGRDSEGVHQLRVGLRRLRSAAAIFRDDLGPFGLEIDRRARRVLKSLGPARDLDVFVEETLPPLAAAGVDTEGAAGLAALAEEARRGAYDDVRRALKRRGFSILVLEASWIAAGGGPALTSDAALPDRARLLLDERHAVALAAGRDFEALTMAQRHRVRIAVKKLRYALDFFASLFPSEEAGAYLATLKKLQDDLGVMNDAAVAPALADSLAGKDATAGRAAAIMRGWLARGLADAEGHIVAHWRGFAAAAPFWRG